jgi:hypothetical protein
MKKYQSPLNKLKIASPCPADWNNMYGDERKRFCSDCKLHVYNLSDMTRQEAENFLINSEGRVCVKFYRRKDGTVLTNNCPVGLAKVKKRVAHATTAIFASAFGLFSGLFAFQQFETNPLDLMNQVVVETDNSIVEEPLIPVAGQPENLQENKGVFLIDLRNQKNKRVVLWIK